MCCLIRWPGAHPPCPAFESGKEAQYDMKHFLAGELFPQEGGSLQGEDMEIIQSFLALT